MALGKDWLRNNIRSILAIIMVLGALGISYVGLFQEVRANDTLTNQIVTAVWNTVIFILGYFYGAAKPQSDSMPSNSTTEIKVTKTENIDDSPK